MGKLRPCGGKDLPRHMSLQNQSLDPCTPTPALSHCTVSLNEWRSSWDGSRGRTHFIRPGFKLGKCCSEMVSFTEGSPQNWPGLIEWWLRRYLGIISSLVSCWNSFIHLSMGQVFIEPRDRKALLASPKQRHLPTSSLSRLSKERDPSGSPKEIWGLKGNIYRKEI